MNNIKNGVNPNSVTIQPPKSGNIAGRILPAPDNPVYNALFSLVVTSNKIPLIEIVLMVKTVPPARKMYGKSVEPGSIKINRVIRMARMEVMYNRY